MKKLFITLGIIWAIGVSINIIFPDYYGSLFARVFLGSISYPSSLDSLENPTPTQSVATAKSHSQQHADANDAIEAIEAKVGITPSTAVSNSIFAGNGAGSSIWTTFATTTSVSTTNLTALGSTTLQNFTAKLGTTTAATTTNFAISSLASQIPYATSTGNIIPLIVGPGLSLLNGTLSSNAATANLYSTTSVQALATTTISNLGLMSVMDMYFHATSTNAVKNGVCMRLNNDQGNNYSYVYEWDDATNNTAGTNVSQVCFTSLAETTGVTLKVKIFNPAADWKRGEFTFYGENYGSGISQITNGAFVWKNNTSQVTSISIGTNNAALFSASTVMVVTGF